MSEHDMAVCFNYFFDTLQNNPAWLDNPQFQGPGFLDVNECVSICVSELCPSRVYFRLIAIVPAISLGSTTTQGQGS